MSHETVNVRLPQHRVSNELHAIAKLTGIAGDSVVFVIAVEIPPHSKSTGAETRVE